MILFRVLAWDASAAVRSRGGALWFARSLQGEGRHDNPALYGCLYASEEPLSPVVERLARFRGRGLRADMLVSSGLPAVLVQMTLADDAHLVDLDDPHVLAGEGLAPSRVATDDRSSTQADAADLFRRHPDAVGLRWASTFGARWTNVTLFDRAEEQLDVEDMRPLGLGDEIVLLAAEQLGLRVST